MKNMKYETIKINLSDSYGAVLTSVTMYDSPGNWAILRELVRDLGGPGQLQVSEVSS